VATPPQKPQPKAGLRPALPAEDAIQKSRREKDELEGECQKLEDELEALKAKYEQYFLGVERKEPVRWREELRKRVLRVKEAFTRNTGLRFRLHSLHARYLSYERLWMRSAREREEGTYRRDLFKARLRAKREEAAPAAPKPAGAPDEAAAAKAGQGARAPAAAPPPAAKAPPPPAQRPPSQPPPSPAVGMGETQLRALFNAYVAAKKSCNEDVSRLTYDAVASSVSKQIPELMARYKAKSVEFRVEVKAGKAILKAIPKV
jgi:hypothetical protein